MNGHFQTIKMSCAFQIIQIHSTQLIFLSRVIFKQKKIKNSNIEFITKTINHRHYD